MKFTPLLAQVLPKARWMPETCSPIQREVNYAVSVLQLWWVPQVPEKDAALERRFQQVYVDQPSAEDNISILRDWKERYEVHHGWRFPIVP